VKSTWFSRWLPVLLVGTFIFLLSSSSDPDGLLPEAVYQWIYRTHVWNIRLTKILGPLAHLSSFGLLAFFLTRALAPRQQNTRNICGLAFLLTCLYALSDEFHQLFVPGRAFELLDLFLDCLGGFTGIFIWHLTHRTESGKAQLAGKS